MPISATTPLKPAHGFCLLVLLVLPAIAHSAQDDANPADVNLRVVDYAFATVQLALAEYDAALASLGNLASMQSDETKTAKARIRYARAHLSGAVTQLADAASGKRIPNLHHGDSSIGLAEEQAKAARLEVENARKSSVSADKVKLLELRLRVANLRLDVTKKSR